MYCKRACSKHNLETPPQGGVIPETISFYSLYGQDTYGIDCGKEANEWMSKFLGKPNMRLLFFDPTTQKRPAKGGFFGKVGIDVPDNAQVPI